MSKLQKRRYLGILLAIAFIAIFYILGNRGTELTASAGTAIGLFLAAISLWVCNVAPMSITAAAIICLYPMFGFSTFKEMISGFGASSVIFIFGTFAITAAMKGTSVPLRLTAAFMKMSGGRSRTLILVFCLASGLLSGIMSSSAVCVMFWSIALIIINTIKESGGKASIGKALGIVLPAACGMGGFITPAGTPGNILLMEFMESVGISITFAQWTLVGLPIVLVGLVVFALWLNRSCRPDDLSEESCAALAAEADKCGGWTARDIKTVVIIAIMIVLWFLGSWIKYFTTAVVAIIGMALMFLPGVDVLNWDSMKKECNTDILLMIGLAPIISNTLSTSGALEYLVKNVFGALFSGDISLGLLAVILSAAVCILRAFIPTPAAVVSLLGPLVYSVAMIAGLNAAGALMIVGFWSAAALLLLYTEPIYFFTFGNGFYTEKDLIRAGWLPCVVMAVVTGVFCPLLVSVAGLS